MILSDVLVADHCEYTSDKYIPLASSEKALKAMRVEFALHSGGKFFPLPSSPNAKGNFISPGGLKCIHSDPIHMHQYSSSIESGQLSRSLFLQ